MTGPRGTAFLSEQFQRLAEAGISVYWAGGESDPPEAWPTAFPLPENIRVFAKDRVTDFLHQYDGSPLARIVGTSRGSRALHPAEFSPDAIGLFSIGVACGDVEIAALQSQGDGLEAHPTQRPSPPAPLPKGEGRLEAYPAQGASPPAPLPKGEGGLEAHPTKGIHYWALGGRAERSTLFTSPGIAHYPGTPQGRSPAESGTHGCTLVNVDDQGRARMTSIATNALEWLHEAVLIDPATRREGLEAMFTERIHSLTAGSKTDLLMTWTIGGSGPLLAELRKGKLRGELLEWLRIEHGLSSPIVWTVGIELEPQNALPASLYEQETILGDFLRALREFELDPQQPLNVESLLADASTMYPWSAAGLFSQAVAIADPATRKRVLHEAALLGMELLGGETGQL